MFSRGNAPSNESYSFFKQWWKDVKSCVGNYGLPTLQNDLNPIPSDSPSGLLSAVQNAVDSASQTAALASGAWSVQRGLTVPLRSSVIRAGITGAETIGKVSLVVTIGTVTLAGLDAIREEYNNCL